MTTTSYPGVYIQELPSGVRPIAGVATSIAAFVDSFSRGPVGKPLLVLSMADFERIFGGLSSTSEASYGIQQFFLNGGTQAWVVRVASGAHRPASTELLSETGAAVALSVEAANPGDWGNHLVVGVDYPEPISDGRFNLTVLLNEARNGRTVPAATEVFRGLTMTPGPRFVDTVVNDDLTGSSLIRVTSSGQVRPLATGTLSGALPVAVTLTNSNAQLRVTIGTEGPAEVNLGVPTATALSPAEVRGFLETAIRAARPGSRAFSQATVTLVDRRLRVRAGPTSADARVTIGAFDATASALELLSGDIFQGRLSDGSASFPLAGGSLGVRTEATPVQTLTLGSMDDLEVARDQLEMALRDATPPELANARVSVIEEGGALRLLVLPGTADAVLIFEDTATASIASDLGLMAPAARQIALTLYGDVGPMPAIEEGAIFDVTIGSAGPHRATVASAASGIAEVATALQEAIRLANPNLNPNPFPSVVVGTVENRLLAFSGATVEAVVFAVAEDPTTVNELMLGNAQANVQAYVLGAEAVLDTAQGTGISGSSGDAAAADDLIAGIRALDDADLFNVLCLPRTSVVSGENALSQAQASAVIAAATDYCESRRAFFIVDTPSNIDDVSEIRAWLEAGNVQRHRNLALYFPRVQISDPLDDFRLRSVGASGTMAGLYARTDSTRGVWKAPAGTEARLLNVQNLDDLLTDGENGVLNPLAINCLRVFPSYGRVCWGARTLEGNDDAGSDSRHVPVRRLTLFLEESLYRGLQWVVFEPNDEPLWAQIRLNVGAFMNRLFRQGAFQGGSAREAYRVTCDATTTTQNDINAGVVNIVVEFAPLVPSEFVVIFIRQLAGQVQV